MTEHLNKPETSLKTQEEIMLKLSSTHESESESAHQKTAFEKTAFEKTEFEKTPLDALDKFQVPCEENERNTTEARETSRLSVESKTVSLHESKGSSFEKISSKGMRRHKVIVGGCLALSLAFLSFSTFDFSSLISQPAYINESNELILEKKKPDLPPSLSYSRTFTLEPEPESDLSLVSKSSWSGRTFGYVDKTGSVVIKPQFQFAQPFSEGLAAVSTGARNEAKWGFIDRTGAFRIPAKFESVGPFRSNGLAIFSLDREVGLMDKNGKEIVKPQYSYLYPLGENYIAGTNRNKVGIINPQGQWILPPDYFSISKIESEQPSAAYDLISGYYNSQADENTKFLKVCKKDLFGIVSADGVIVIPAKYDEIVSFNNGVAGVKIDGKIGFVDTKGNIIISPTYDDATQFADLIAVEVGKKWKFIDKFGRAVSSPPIDRVVNDVGGDWFADGLGPIIQGNKIGYINTRGELAIPAQFDVGFPFSKGYAAVWSGDRWHFIDTRGKFVPGYSFSFLTRPRGGKVVTAVPGILYPFVSASRIKRVRDNIRNWITGERPRMQYPDTMHWF